MIEWTQSEDKFKAALCAEIHWQPYAVNGTAHKKWGTWGMETGGIREKVIQEICDLARKYQVERVILFGSRARGDYHRTSDIDLAVTGGDFARFALDLEEETSTLLRYDLVHLDGAVQPELRESIAREGKVLYEKV